MTPAEHAEMDADIRRLYDKIELLRAAVEQVKELSWEDTLIVDICERALAASN